MEKEIIRDIICSVLANDCSKETIDRVLAEFIPGYESINLGYVEHPYDSDYIFHTEDEMINYFIECGLDQTFYWNKSDDNPDHIMVGAVILSDKKLVVSLTIDGTKETEEKYYLKLKALLGSEIGVISYVNPPEYKNGEDFAEKYKDLLYTFEVEK
jgi:hypothetical protein